jgi:hypothetical protein
VAVKPEEVVVGACFVTTTNQVRKVIEITADDCVSYMARGASSKMNFSWGSTPIRSQLPSRVEFANQVDRGVRCDWDKDYPERKP